MASVDNEQPDLTLADYVGIALSPVLIITLVASLVLFLLEVCYSGNFVERMRWILFFFVFGIVFVWRLSMMQEGADRSSLYGLILAACTWFGLQAYIKYPEDTLIRELAPVINLGLIAIVWWSSGKLVYNCTNIGDNTNPDGEGLLQASGLEQTGEDETEKELKPAVTKTSTTGLIAAWERYQRYSDEARKKRALGVWVVYFSLAALPLFGLGEALIPVTDVHRRQFSFWLLGIYVASGLGLLMTTCFLNLRRYLRRRKLRMPAAMTAVWLTFGVLLIVVLLVIGALLPRPQAEYSFINLQSLTSGEKSASQHAVKGDSPGKGNGRASQSSNQNDPNANKTTSGKGEKGKEKDSGSGQDKSGSGGDQKGDKQDKDGEKGDKQDKNNGGEKSDKRDQANRSQQDRDSRSSQSSQRSQSEGRKQDDAGRSQEEQTSSVRDMFRSVAQFLKWVVFAIVAVIVVGVVFFAILRFLANFSALAAGLLNLWLRWRTKLFARRKKGASESEQAQARRRPPPPFSSFHNPFRLGQRWSPYEMTCYTFAAFEAWSRERGLGRQMGETPLEYGERVDAEIPDLSGYARRLALIYARGLYGPVELPEAINDVLRQVWDCLESGVAQPVR